MRHLVLVLMTFGIVFFNSCKKSGIDGFNLDRGMDIFVFDQDGNDLLDPHKSYEKSIDIDQLWLYRIVDDKEVRVYDGNLSSPRGFILREPGKYSTYYLFGWPSGDSAKIRTLIKWSEHDVDTIDAHMAIGDGYRICTKLELNGEEVWNVKTSSVERSITFIK